MQLHQLSRVAVGRNNSETEIGFLYSVAGTIPKSRLIFVFTTVGATKSLRRRHEGASYGIGRVLIDDPPMSSDGLRVLG